jgi:hypothetical protein
MTTHGGCDTRLNRIWIGMRARCRNPRDTTYRHYGGRGITVSPAWDDFAAFRSWSLANGYSNDLELDRIDNNGPYSPRNCQWVTHKANTRNTRRTRWVEYRGRCISVADLADETGVPVTTLRTRIFRHGMTPEEAAKLTRGV